MQEYFLRSHGHHGSTSDHRRPGVHSHQHRSHNSSSSMSHNSHKLEGHKKQGPQVSRRSLATITVGLDASPSKVSNCLFYLENVLSLSLQPLGRSELERLKLELESVRNQLNMESMSPSSLSPCSDDDHGGKSPAQLLSPVSPLLKSPGNVMVRHGTP